MNNYTKQQLESAKGILEYLNQSFMNDDGILDKSFEDALMEYRNDKTRENYIKVLCTLVLHDVYMPYKSIFADGEERKDVICLKNEDGRLAQLLSSSPERISKWDAMERSWKMFDGLDFFKAGSQGFICEFAIVNHDNDHFVFHSKEIIPICDYISKLDCDDFDYTEDDICAIANIFANEKKWKDNKGYVNKKTGKVYNGFPYITYDSKHFKTYYYFVDKDMGLIELTSDECDEIEGFLEG